MRDLFIIRLTVRYGPEQPEKVGYHGGQGRTQSESLDGAKIYGSWRRVRQAYSLHFKNPQWWCVKAEIVKLLVVSETVCDPNLKGSD